MDTKHVKYIYQMKYYNILIKKQLYKTVKLMH